MKNDGHKWIYPKILSKLNLLIFKFLSFEDGQTPLFYAIFQAFFSSFFTVSFAQRYAGLLR